MLCAKLDFNIYIKKCLYHPSFRACRGIKANRRRVKRHYKHPHHSELAEESRRNAVKVVIKIFQNIPLKQLTRTRLWDIIIRLR